MPQVLLHLLPDGPALGVPEDQARGVVLKVEEVEGLAKLAMVSALGLFELVQVLLEVFLFGPGRAVDPLEHLIAMVASPVGAGHLHELEDLELACRGHMRASAEVDEVALAVERDLLARRNAGDDLGLVMFTHRLEQAHSGITVHDFSGDGLILAGQLAHLRLDGGKILWSQRAFVREVVIKAVVDDGADGDLKVWEQAFGRVGQQVGRGVPNDVQAIWVFLGDNRKRRVLIDEVVGVDQLPIHTPGQCGLGQPRPDACRHRGHGHGGFE